MASKNEQIKDGAQCQVVGGVHAGKSGIVRDLKVGKTMQQVSITVVQADGQRFKTLAKNVIVGPAAKASRAGVVAQALPGAPKRKASKAKLAVGSAPVRAYIASLPAASRAIIEHFDALASRTLPGIQRSIKWGMPFYGTTNGWFVSCGAFVNHVKITFLQGVRLEPTPPCGTGKRVRGIEVRHEDDLDDNTLVSWLRQASILPGLGAKK